MQRPDWAPEDIDTETFSAARVYDYLLGGSHNFAVDREAARRALAIMPDLAIQARANRAFLLRAVRWLANAGVRQFLDIGSGIPTRGNIHEVAQKVAPEARVGYVDIDPVAVAHSRHILADNDGVTVVQADLREPEVIVNHPEIRALLDFDQPVAILMLAILHAIGDEDDPYAIVAQLREALSPGGYLVISHISQASRPETVTRMAEMTKPSPYPITPRSTEELRRFFTDLTLVEPGIVWAPLWHPEPPEHPAPPDEPDDDPARSSNLVGVGRKP